LPRTIFFFSYPPPVVWHIACVSIPTGRSWFDEANAPYRFERRENLLAKKKKSPKKKRWPQHVTETSNALDLDKGVFAPRVPRAIARSLKRSAARGRRRKVDPFRSAMSMLNFYINRAGRKLSLAQRSRLEAAKVKLNVLFHRKPKSKRKGTGT
jgi:hypothetical protein